LTEFEGNSTEENNFSNNRISRRDFLKFLGAGAVTIGMANFIGIDKLLQSAFAKQENYNYKDYNNNNTNSSNYRSEKAFDIRVDAARFERDISIPPIYNNGDESLYKNKIAGFSKGLPHNNLGEVDLEAYSKLVHALYTKDFKDFENIPLGGNSQLDVLQTLGIGATNLTNQISAFEYKSNPSSNSNDDSSGSNNSLKLINPMAAFSFALIGPDSHNLFLKPAPTFDSAEEAGEIAEVYWQAIGRDIAFTEYDSNPLIDNASKDLSNFSRFYGPKQYGNVTPKTIFRGNTFGDLNGPYISQFLLKPIPYGALTIDQKYHVAAAGSDFMTSYSSWLSCQNGLVTETENLDGTPRYLRNGRDLAEYVHKDFPFLPYLNACLILLGSGSSFDTGNVYSSSITQIGFSTFGAPHVLSMISTVANLAIKAAWFQKWLVHRRLRPEKFGGCIHNNMIGRTEYPINYEILDSAVLDIIYKQNKTYFLPMSYPEGCPTHPAYPAGHATVAGACTTILKVFFDENTIILDAVIPNSDGQNLIPYRGSEVLTVCGELNKLASNISIGRDFAGVHWRSDAISGMKLGEELAIRYLLEQKNIFFEKSSFRFTKFDVTRTEIKL